MMLELERTHPADIDSRRAKAHDATTVKAPPMTTHPDDFDRAGDQQSAYSEDEKERILKTARAQVAGYDDDEKFEIGDDGPAYSESEKAEILRTAHDAVRRDATTGMVTKVKEDAFVEPEAPEPRQPRQRYHQRRRRSEASADPIKGTAWPAPREGNLDITIEGLIGVRVGAAFAEQHDYLLELMAQSLAYSVERDGVVERAIADAIEKERRHHRRESRKLQAQIENLQHALDELRDAVALQKSRTISLPPLLVSDLN
jgi:hypothetical protein